MKKSTMLTVAGFGGLLVGGAVFRGATEQLAPPLDETAAADPAAVEAHRLASVKFAGGLFAVVLGAYLLGRAGA